jgi:hypothetical protein
MSQLSTAVVTLLRSIPENDRESVFTACLTDESMRPMVVSILARGVSDGGKQSDEAKRHELKIVISYDVAGELAGQIRGYDLRVKQFGRRRFRTYVNGVEHSWLEMDFVEGTLGLSVHRKSSGGNSETLARAIWRNFADQYNKGDKSVTFTPAS